MEAKIMQWQPIETAPRDGTRVLLYGDIVGPMKGDRWPDRMEVASLDDEDAGCHWPLQYWLSMDPTHWMPLPDPPTGD